MKQALTGALALALVLSLAACGPSGPAFQSASVSEEAELTGAAKTGHAAPEGDGPGDASAEQAQPYVLTLDSLPDDLLFAFEYGYASYHTGEEDLSEDEKLPLELGVVRDWCAACGIALPDNLDSLYPQWRAQYEAGLSGGDAQAPDAEPAQTDPDPVQPGDSGDQQSNPATSSGASGGSPGTSGDSTVEPDMDDLDEYFASIGYDVPGVNAPTSGTGIDDGEPGDGGTPDPKDLVNGNTGGFHP